MNNRALTLSVLMAIIAVFFVQSYVESIEKEAEKKYGGNIIVLAAKEDIKEMATLDETMIGLKTIPKKFLEPAAIFFEKSKEDPETLKELKALAGTVAIVPIKKGEQLTYNKITEPNLRTGLAPQVSPGKRAVAVPVSEATGVGKLVKPGDRVDVIAVVDVGTGRNSKAARTLLQDVAVLSVGRSITNNVSRVMERDPFKEGALRARSLASDDTFASVTLEVDPAQAQSVALVIAGGGVIILSLRNNDDSERMGVAPLQMNGLFQEVRAPAEYNPRTSPPKGAR